MSNALLEVSAKLFFVVCKQNKFEFSQTHCIVTDDYKEASKSLEAFFSSRMEEDEMAGCIKEVNITNCQYFLRDEGFEGSLDAWEDDHESIVSYLQKHDIIDPKDFRYDSILVRNVHYHTQNDFFI
jgi:hypothetical protein